MNNDQFKDAIKLELKKRIDEGTYEDLEVDLIVGNMPANIE